MLGTLAPHRLRCATRQMAYYLPLPPAGHNGLETCCWQVLVQSNNYLWSAQQQVARQHINQWPGSAAL